MTDTPNPKDDLDEIKNSGSAGKGHRAIPSAETKPTPELSAARPRKIFDAGFKTTALDDHSERVALDCGCVNRMDGFIDFCPLHAPAHALYEALRKLLIGMPSFSDEPVGPESAIRVSSNSINITVGDVRLARAALALANGLVTSNALHRKDR